MSPPRALEVCNLNVSFSGGGAAKCAVDDVSLELFRGECFGVVGESGSGKSTLCRAIAGLLPQGSHVSGRVLLGQADLLSLRRAALDEVRQRDLAMIFQEPSSYLNPVYTIGWQLEEAIGLGRPNGWNSRASSAKEAAGLLRSVGITDVNRVLPSYPHQMSGGMCQRIMIAMAIARNPRLLLADEPTTALDVTIQAQILGLLRRLIDDFGLTVLLVTHDLGVVAEVCDRVGVAYAGRLVEIGPVEQIFNAPRHPYTAALLRAAPRLEAMDGDLNPIPYSGSSDDPTALGCAFSERCERVGPDCHAVRPAVKAMGSDRLVACHAPIS